jgi:catechol 2,3-dioxygenase-like lactoylglutathione lyase family enzyme
MNLTELAYFTDNVKEMTDFYQRLLGERPVAQSEQMTIFAVGGVRLFIHYRYPLQQGELRAENHIAFQVENVDEACRELVKQGLTVEIAPHNFYWGRSAYLRDPDGHQIEITQKEKENHRPSP